MSAIYALGITICQQTTAAPILVIPVCAAGAILVALNMGPSLANWRLTGHQRIAVGVLPENSAIGRV